MVKTTMLTPMPPGANPFAHDSSRQGTSVGNSNSWTAMWDPFDDDGIVMVHRRTGLRIKLKPPQ